MTLGWANTPAAYAQRAGELRVLEAELAEHEDPVGAIEDRFAERDRILDRERAEAEAENAERSRRVA